jgi:peroxiredoxin
MTSADQVGSAPSFAAQQKGNSMRYLLGVSAPLVAVLAVCIVLAGQAPANDPPAKNVGKKIANLTFTDANGKTTQLYDLKDKKAIVLVFLSFECPVSKSYSQPLADMANELSKQDVQFIGLTVNQDESPAEIAKQALEFKLPFPVVLDRYFAATDALIAEHTPEAFVLDSDFVLRYRGRIDDSFYARLKKHQQVTEYDLSQALAELLSGRPVSVPVTEAIGCAIVRDAKPAENIANVTYYKDVLPILQRNCQECHRPGEVGPFSLMTYRQAVNWATDIKEYTRSRQMPPWKLSEGLPFHNERRLSDREIAVLTAWSDNGTAEGNPLDAPPPAKFSEGWKLGTPDMVLTLPDDYQVGPSGNDVFRCFVLPTNLTEDKYVESIEVRPGNPRVVHHAILYIDTAGNGRKLEQKQLATPPKESHGGTELDKGPGYYGAMGPGFTPVGTLGGWAPGQLPRNLPDGTGIKLPKGSDIVMQVHYHRDGKLEKDKTSIGIYFSKKRVERPFQGGVMSGLFLVIPAGNDHFVVKGTSYVTDDMTLYDIMPHMHMVGKAIKVTMTPPGGQPVLLFNVPQWDYNWQETYYFKEPLHLKPGTRLDLEAVYDNSANNPSNPFSPPRAVLLGEQTFNEMCFVFLGGTSERRGTGLPLAKKAPAIKDKDPGTSYNVPYRLTDSGHILVRAKLNGKGPFNFIVDTGAPHVYLATAVAKQIGITAAKKGLTAVETIQIEGGPVLPEFKCVIETPFQLEGMNALGMPGVELHGVFGYTLLSRFKLEFDPTKDSMTWTKLDFTPPAPQSLGAKGPEGLDGLGKMMKAFAALMGIKGAPQPMLRGFVGVQLSEVNKGVVVQAVLANSPAATAGVQIGDRVLTVQGTEVATAAEVMTLLAKVLPGQQVSFVVERGEGRKEISITAGEGI